MSQWQCIWLVLYRPRTKMRSINDAALAIVLFNRNKLFPHYSRSSLCRVRALPGPDWERGTKMATTSYRNSIPMQAGCVLAIQSQLHSSQRRVSREVPLLRLSASASNLHWIQIKLMWPIGPWNISPDRTYLETSDTPLFMGTIPDRLSYTGGERSFTIGATIQNFSESRSTGVSSFRFSAYYLSIDSNRWTSGGNTG